MLTPGSDASETGAPQRQTRWWAVYLAGGAVLTVAHVFLHANFLFNLVGISSPVAILIGIRLNRPANKLPWLLFAAGQALFVGGDILTYNYPAIFGTDLPFPSLGDPLYLAVYPCLVVGLLLVVRSRTPGGDIGSLIDSLIIAIGVATLSWVLVLSPLAGSADATLVQKIVSVAYPILDLILLGVLVRLVVGPGRRSVGLYFMAVATLALFATDGVYNYISIQGIVYDHSGQLELGWAAFYLLWGAAALHGSMTGLTTRAPDADRPISTVRLGILAASALLAEMVHALDDWADGTISDPILYGVSMLLFILVLIRLGGLVQRAARSAEREKTLRQAGASLVAATDRDSVYRATIAGAQKLAGLDSAVGVLMLIDFSSTLRLVASEGDLAGLVGELSPLKDETRKALIDQGFAWVALGGATTGRAVLLPLTVRSELRGVLVVAATVPPTTTVIGSLEALAVQSALAVEGAELGEVVATRRSQQWFASLVQNASDVILVIDPDASIHFVSPASQRVLGYQPEQLLGRLLTRYMVPDEVGPFHSRLDLILRGRDAASETMEFQLMHADGHWLNVETQPSNLLNDPNVNGIVLNVRDVSERKAFEAQLAHQAFYDSLTGLANRALFQNRVEHALASRRRRGVLPSVMFMDLDDFKTVNDSLGHASGDRLLASVAARLQKCLRASDTAARLGGDEFAVLIEDAALPPTELADRVLEALADPFDVDGTEVHVRASIGIAVATTDGRGPEAVASLLRNADVAMYSAKGDGGGAWRVFDMTMLDAARRRLELKSTLDRALEANEFLLNFQPVIDLASGHIRGVEALIRWMHPRRGLVPPLDFIPLAEETGQIVAIGGWVLTEACRAAIAFQVAHPSVPPVYMAVNLSGYQLQRPEIVAEVAMALKTSGLAAHDLVLEITESVLMRDTSVTIERLKALKDLGVRLAIDDFGTGYSSLNYIRQFPVDIVKIDKSFIDGIASEGDGRALVAMIVDLTRALGLAAIAEGIEDENQLAALRSLGCGFGQGFFFARPVRFEDVLSLLATSGAAQPAA